MLFLSEEGVTSVGADVAVSIVLVLMTLLSVGAAIVFLCRFADAEVKKRKFVLPIILAAGFVIRLIFALCIRGNRPDYSIFSGAISQMGADGLGVHYAGDPLKSLYPAVYFVYMIFGGFANITGLSGDSLGLQFIIKLPLIIAELLTAYAVYRIATRYFDRGIGYVLAALMCACPIFFIASSVWTSPVVFVAMFAVYAFYFLARRKYAAAIAFATAAAYSGKEGIYIFPVMAVFCIFHIVRAAVNIKNDNPKGKEIWAADYRAVITVPVAFVLSLTCAYLISLFMMSSYSANPFVGIYELLIKPFGAWEYFTYNGLSVYAMFGQNGVTPGARFPSWVFFGIFAAIVTVVVCVVYFSKRNRATLVLLASYSLVTMQIYYPGSTGAGFATAFAAVLAAYALTRDRRILYVLFLSGLMYVINTMCALSASGYINNLAEHEFTDKLPTIPEGGIAAVMIACSVLTTLAHLYFTYVTVSVGMSGQKQMLSPVKGIGASMKEFFGAKKKEG